MNEVLGVLQALAELDHALHHLSGRLSDLDQEEAALKERLRQEDEGMARRREAHRKLRQAALDRTAEADATDAKIREYQRKLDHEIISYKEMEFLREQVKLLRARLDQLSEEALRLMDAVEEDAQRLAEDEQRHKERRARLLEELQALGKKREELQQARTELEARRGEALGRLPPPVRQRYEQLRARLPNPVVYVDGQACSGCHLRLSEATLLKLREGREVVTCENCSRFLLLRW
ncbi:MAG: C4-type zinc ribbon domain-containing protein [Candidatus Bipolaricaulota bacterium]|nr:C4-type zinc ribbon domain-containing protein [Candidatus Bipolaricaulota bacterium]